MSEKNHGPVVRIAALLTCHNRKDSTIECLEAIKAEVSRASGPAGKTNIDPSSPLQTSPRYDIQIFLVDDGSSDGTAKAVLEVFPKANIYRSDGHLFWCRGMKKAWEMAVPSSPDYFLWLNDDTRLLPGSLSQLISHASRPEDTHHLQVAVANCRDPDLGVHTYGGYRRPGGHPLILSQLPMHPTEEVFADTFNGNVVLIPRAVFEIVGGMGNFAHGLGDLDYGYRVIRAGGKIVLPPGYSAECRRGTVATYWIKGPGRRKRWQMLNDRKAGLPWKDWLRFSKAHGGELWPLIWIRPYLRVALDL